MSVAVSPMQSSPAGSIPEPSEQARAAGANPKAVSEHPDGASLGSGRVFLLDGYLPTQGWPEIAELWKAIRSQSQLLSRWDEPSALPRLLAFEHWLCTQLGWNPQSLDGLACWALPAAKGGTPSSEDDAARSEKDGALHWDYEHKHCSLLRPCHFYVRLDHVGVVALEDASLSWDEAMDLRAALEDDLPTWREWFEAWFDIRAIDPMRWLLVFDHDSAQLEGCSLGLAEGLNVEHYLVQGRQSRIWRRVLNQIQMLWYEHPVNVARERAGLLPVNALWLAGALRPGYRNPSRLFQVKSQLAVFKGLDRYIRGPRQNDRDELHVMTLDAHERTLDIVIHGLRRLMHEIDTKDESKSLELVFCAEHAWEHYRVAGPKRRSADSFWQRWMQRLVRS